MTPPVCPKCHALKSTEPIAHSWWYCNSCSARLLCDAEGNVIRVELK